MQFFLIDGVPKIKLNIKMLRQESINGKSTMKEGYYEKDQNCLLVCHEVSLESSEFCRWPIFVFAPLLDKPFIHLLIIIIN